MERDPKTIKKEYVETLEYLNETIKGENDRLRDENERLRDENERVRYVIKDDGLSVMGSYLINKARDLFEGYSWSRKR
jgi:predicted nuclease with TOPRIM domain